MKSFTVTVQLEEEFTVEARTQEEAEAIVEGLVADGDHGVQTSSVIVDSFQVEADDESEEILD